MTFTTKYARILLFLTTLLCFNQLKAQLSLRVEAPSTVGIDDAYFQLRYTIESADASNSISAKFNDFNVLSGPNLSVSSYTSVVNGKRTSGGSKTYTYTLSAKSKGTFTIAPASVTVNGRTYKSRAVTIKVKDGGTGGNSSSSSSSQTSSGGGEELRKTGSPVSSNDLYIKPSVSHQTVYEQEPVLLTYKYYERLGVGLNSIGLSQKPDFKGLVSLELPIKNIEAFVAHLNGQTYRTGNISQFVLYPQQSGSITIPAITFDCAVVQREEGIDPLDIFFNGGGSVGLSLKRQAEAITLNVKPLPTPKPVGFSGGVGDFKVTGKLLSSDIRTNEMLTYRVEVSGKGNLKMISAPTLSFPADFDTYTPKTVDSTRVTAEGIVGSVYFDYTFVPRNVGQYDVPSFSFVYFDPKTAEYKTIDVPSVRLDIKKGTKSDAEVERERQLRNSDIRPIITDNATVRPAAAYYFYGTWRYWALYALVIFAFASVMIWLKAKAARQSDTVGMLRSKAAKKAKRSIKNVRKHYNGSNTSDAIDELSKTIKIYISEAFDIPIADVTKERIQLTMPERGISETATAECIDFIAECEFHRFSPSAKADDALTFCDRADSIINSIEEGRQGRPSTPTASPNVQ